MVLLASTLFLFGSNNVTLLYSVANGTDPKPVRLDQLAPDLAMVNLSSHKIKWRELHKDPTPLGEGKKALFPLERNLFSTAPPSLLILISVHNLSSFRRLCNSVQGHLARRTGRH